MSTENRKIIIWKDLSVLCVAFFAAAGWAYTVLALAALLIRQLVTTDVALSFALITLIRGIGLFLIGFWITVFLKWINPWYCLASLTVLVIVGMIVSPPWQDLTELAAVQHVSETSLLTVYILGPVLSLFWFGLGIAAGRWYRRNSD